MYLDITYKKLTLSDKQVLFNFITKINNCFTPALDSKTNLDLFCEKILSLGNVVVAQTAELVVGVITFCANDLISKKAYVSVVGVDPNYSGNHIATNLLIKAIKLSKNNKMDYITIHANNII